jgi:structure-specific endonuclease subunit SLX1
VCEVALDGSHVALLRCTHPDCRMAAHLPCLADRFLRREGGATTTTTATFLIPCGGDCPTCGVRLLWSDLVYDWRRRQRRSAGA